MLNSLLRDFRARVSDVGTAPVSTLSEAKPEAPLIGPVNRSIPELEARQASVKNSGQAASDADATRQQLAIMMADLLGLEKVEDDDNFFMLGGHSLFGTQLIMRIREQFGLDISLRTVFTRPTVAGIAAEIDRLMAQ